MDTFKEENERINLSFNMQECVDTLLECFKASGSCIQYCLSLGGKHATQEHISIMLECSEICETCADFLMSDSNFAHELCGICARVCDACAESCREVDYRDQQLKAYADVCRTCAEACRNMEH